MQEKSHAELRIKMAAISQPGWTLTQGRNLYEQKNRCYYRQSQKEWKQF